MTGGVGEQAQLSVGKDSRTLLSVQCVYDSPEDLIKLQILMQ